jgi:hypothetical protein
MFFIDLLKAESRLHLTFLGRLKNSSDSFYVKFLKFIFYVEFLAPSRYLSANSWMS